MTPADITRLALLIVPLVIPLGVMAIALRARRPIRRLRLSWRIKTIFRNRTPKLPAQSAAPPATGWDFHKAEFTALKAEIAEHLKSTSANFQYALAATAGIFTWLALNGQSLTVIGHAAKYVAWLPYVLTVLLASLTWSASVQIGRISAYVRRLEKALGMRGFGWERAFAKRIWTFAVLYWYAWIALLVVDGAMAWYISGHWQPTGSGGPG